MILPKFESLVRPLLKIWLPDLFFEKLTFFMRLGYWPNLSNTRSFNEIISWQKLHENPFPHPELIDKLTVREHVRKAIGDSFLTEIYEVFYKPAEIDIAALPSAFVLKCNAGSGLNIIVPNSRKTSNGSIRKTCLRWFAQPYSRLSHTNERMYDEIKRKVFAEEMLGPLEFVREYKFWCFFGNPEFIQVSEIVKGKRLYRLFNSDWSPCAYSIFNPPLGFAVPRPSCLDELCDLARMLSRGLNFVRVDLNVSEQNRITFGELTFRPGAGRVRFFPCKKDFDLGDLIKGAAMLIPEENN